MKKISLVLVGIIMMIAGAWVMMGCETSVKIVEKESMQRRSPNAYWLESHTSIAFQEIHTEANAAEWKSFRNEFEVKTRNNEISIAELKVKDVKPGKAKEILYHKRIRVLEQQNNDLKGRMEAYEQSQSDWRRFESEYKYDMDDLLRSLKDLAEGNTT